MWVVTITDVGGSQAADGIWPLWNCVIATEVAARQLYEAIEQAIKQRWPDDRDKAAAYFELKNATTSGLVEDQIPAPDGLVGIDVTALLQRLEII